MSAVSGEMAQELFDGAVLKGAYHAALLKVERHVDELNLLNVFPVPDGDTGINMFVTLRAAHRAAAEVSTDSAAVVASAAARGALLGASGNSGVILSQILRGLAKGLAMRERFSSSHFAQALHEATENAYRAVSNPVEGTILTVSKRASQTAMRMAERGANLRQIMTAVVADAREAVKTTPELLPQLKEAGVVDAGAKGLLYIFQGMKDSFSNHMVQSGEKQVSPGKQERPAATPESGTLKYGFDLQFLVRGEHLPVPEMRSHIDGMGESVLVVGDETLVRVHIHTAQPQAVLDYARTVGTVSDIVNQDMDRQVEEFRSGPAGRRAHPPARPRKTDGRTGRTQ